MENLTIFEENQTMEQESKNLVSFLEAQLESIVEIFSSLSIESISLFTLVNIIGVIVTLFDNYL